MSIYPPPFLYIYLIILVLCVAAVKKRPTSAGFSGTPGVSRNEFWCPIDQNVVLKQCINWDTDWDTEF
jgi:hypothetical protein